ncbi:I78 family peptidase inhibitor [Luteimonas soli]|uniref:I78 family peptidase inhibitor n=1 Tax=Luteimonas soli TaxID=1648966 RepID=A0ABV7XKF0_9GAMM
MNIARHPPSLVALVAALALGACATPPGDAAAQAQAAQAGNDVIAPDPASAPADAATQCNADAAQSYIGQDASEATVAQAKAAAGATGALRVIKPGQPVTMDFRADRLNVEVDDGNAIVRISCG